MLNSLSREGVLTGFGIAVSYLLSEVRDHRRLDPDEILDEALSWEKFGRVEVPLSLTRSRWLVDACNGRGLARRLAGTDVRAVGRSIFEGGLVFDSEMDELTRLFGGESVAQALIGALNSIPVGLRPDLVVSTTNATHLAELLHTTRIGGSKQSLSNLRDLVNALRWPG